MPSSRKKSTCSLLIGAAAATFALIATSGAGAADAAQIGVPNGPGKTFGPYSSPTACAGARNANTLWSRNKSECYRAGSSWFYYGEPVV